jgi:hypothetical protein
MKVIGAALLARAEEASLQTSPFATWSPDLLR